MNATLRRYSPGKILLRCIIAGISVCLFCLPVKADKTAVYSVSNEVQQKRKISGIIRDELEDPLTGCSVVLKGKIIGTTTDQNGHFELEVSNSDVLVINFLGYKEQEVAVGNKTSFEIQLLPNTTELDEVQVIAFGKQKKMTVTGSLSSVNTSELVRSPNASVANILAGTMSGVTTVQYSGQPGVEEPEIFVRGTASLDTERSRPLILVDGVERSFTGMDPNEIENVTVLKDASATAVFGVRGANGVILVTTRRGQEGKVSISLSSSVGFSEAMRLPKMANSYNHALAYNAMELSDNPDLQPNELRFSPYVLEMFRTGADPIMFPDTDWKKMLFKDYSAQYQENITISGGSKSVRYFVSLGYLHQDGILKKQYESYDPNYKNNRYNFRSNLDVNVTKTTLLKLNIGGRYESRNEPNNDTSLNNIWMEILRCQPFSSPGFVDGKLVENDNTYISTVMRSGFLPYYGKGYRTYSGNTLNLDLELSQKLDFITKGLSAEIKGAYNTSYTGQKTFASSVEKYTPIYLSTIENPGLALDDPAFDHTIVYRQSGSNNELSYAENWNSKSRDWYMEMGLRYNRTFASAHNIGGLFLYNMSKIYYPSLYTDIPRGYLGLVGRLTYDYKNKYMFDFNIGYNGSENFASNKRYGTFPAFSVGWVLSEESFMKKLPFVNFLKLRASYGIVGNDILGNYRFLYLPDSYNSNYLGWRRGYYFGENTAEPYAEALELALGNPHVTWEKAAKQNYGIDFYTLDQRLSITADLFYEKRKDILIKQNTVPGFVAADLPVVNMGKVNNEGYELTLGWNDKIGKTGRYWTKFNLSYAHNEIIFKDEIPQNEDYMYETGRSVGLNKGYVFDRFFEDGDFNEDGSLKEHVPAHSGSGFKPGDIMFKDLNDDGYVNGDDVTYFGYSENPEYIFGLLGGFELGGFDFSMTWTAATNVSRVMTEDFTRPFNTGNAPIMQYMIDESWTPERGQSAKFPRLTNTNRSHNAQASSFWVRDASYLRLKNLEIGYSMSLPTLKKVGIQKIRFYVNGYNLLTFDHLKFIDPESKISNNNRYPNTRIYNFGLNVNF